MSGELEDPETMPQVIAALSSLLQRVADSNGAELRHGGAAQKISVFNGLTKPAISVHSYLQRIFKYVNCSSSCYVVAYVYLDRFSRRQPLFPINPFNVHRLLITSVLVSAKFMDGRYYNNAYYAKVGGISIAEMNLLEVDFLFGLGFQLNVTPNTFHTYCSHLQQEMLMLTMESPLHDHVTSTSQLMLLHSCFNEDDQSSSSSPPPSTTHQKQLADGFEHIGDGQDGQRSHLTFKMMGLSQSGFVNNGHVGF